MPVPLLNVPLLVMLPVSERVEVGASKVPVIMSVLVDIALAPQVKTPLLIVNAPTALMGLATVIVPVALLVRLSNEPWASTPVVKLVVVVEIPSTPLV